MSQVAYNSKLVKGGLPVTIAGEPMTRVSATVYEITDKTRSILDFNSSINVTVDSVPVNIDEFEVDYLFGIITFENNIDAASDVEIDCTYVPTVSVGKANSYNLSIGAEIIDSTNFDGTIENGGFMEKEYGLFNVSSSVSVFDDALRAYQNNLIEKDTLLLEIKPGNSDNDIIRGWFIVDSVEKSGDLGSLETETINFMLKGNIEDTFSWRTI